jgi:hypothetical protein
VASLLHERFKRRQKVELPLHPLQMGPGRILVAERRAELATALSIKAGNVRKTENPEELLLENLGGVGLQTTASHKLISLLAADGGRGCRRPLVKGRTPVMVWHH